jgi:hypothetical protein
MVIIGELVVGSGQSEGSGTDAGKGRSTAEHRCRDIDPFQLEGFP